MNKNCITVIVLCYENQEYIIQTLESIFMQKGILIQLIISDDCSTKFDKEKIEKYILKNKPDFIIDFYVISNKSNLGTVVHANKIVELSNCEFVKFLSCGDAFYNSESLFLLKTFAETYKENVVISKSVVCSRNLSKELYLFPNEKQCAKLYRLSPNELFEILLESNIISAIGSIFRREFFIEGGFDETYRYLEDFPLWLSLSRRGIKIPFFNEITVKYGVGGSSSKFGNAYDSGILKNDLILCYEKEILPYIKKNSFFKLKLIMYKYKKIKEYNNYNVLKKMIFKLQFLYLEIYFFIKKVVKGIIINEKL